MTDLNPDQFPLPEPTPEQKKHYNRGWASSKRGGGLERADARGEPEHWYDGYTDYAIGLEKGHSLRCRGCPGMH